MTLESKPLPVCRVDIEEKQCVALLDSGATSSLIKRSMIRKTIGEYASNHVLRGLGDSSITKCKKLDLNISICGIKFQESFVIVPDDSIKYGMVLGDSFMAKHKLGIDLSVGRLFHSGKDGSWEIYYSETNPEVIFRNLVVRAAEEVVMTDSEPLLIPVFVPLLKEKTTIKDLSEMYYDGELAGRIGQSVCGTIGILDVKENNTVVQLEKFPGKYQQKEVIRKGLIVGTISNIVEVMAINAKEEEPEMVSDWLETLSLPSVSPDEIQQVKEMLRRRSAALSKGDHDVGCAIGVTQHKIELHDNTPIRQKPRRFPEPVVEEIERQCKELLNLDIIEHSRSPWSSPMVPITKKDGTLRLCIDYRKLNKVTIADRFPMPNMMDQVFSLHGTKFFTTLDLVKGYYQVPLDPGSSECTAFSTSRNHYQFKRLSFGLKNAPGAFQREMQAVLHGFSGNQVVIYIDDILILGKTLEEHLDLVERVLSTLEKAGMKVKPSKCSWFQEEVTFLGHIVGRSGIKKSPEYTKSISDFPQPTTVKELRSFMGLVNFQRKFIKNCSEICKPLNQLLGSKDSCKIKWDDEKLEAIQKLKDSMVADLELAYPDYGLSAEPLIMSTDASKIGAGACLTQRQGNEDRVIAYASTTFNKSQSKYSAIEQELAAIRWAVKVFKSFIYGIHFILYTDHRPLVYMCNMAGTNARIMRTLQELEEFNFEVRYRPGKDNQVADILSRIEKTPNLTKSSEVTTAVPEGLHLIRCVQGGGNSLVESLWEVLRNHKFLRDSDTLLPSDCQALREELAIELLSRPEFYGFHNDRATRAKLRMSKFDGSAPPVEFFMAFNVIFKLQVYVHHGFDRPFIYVMKDEQKVSVAKKRIHLQCISGIHYNPLLEKNGYEFTASEEQDKDITVLKEVNSDDECGEMTDVSVNLQHEISVDCVCSRTSTSTQVLTKIGPVVCCTLVDTGAQISLLSYSAWVKIRESNPRCDFNPDIVRIRTIGDKIVHTIGHVVLRYSIEDRLISEPVPFAIMKDSDIPYCVILGANAIAKGRMIIDYNSSCLILSDHGKTHVIRFRDLQLERNAENYVSVVDLSEKFSSNTDSLLTQWYTKYKKIDVQEILKMQKSCNSIRKLYSKIRNGIPVSNWNDNILKRFQSYASQFVIREGILWLKEKDSSLIVASRDFLQQLTSQVHAECCHPGRNKLIMMMKEIVWSPFIQPVVENICSTCDTCQKYKISSQRVPPPMKKLQISHPFDLVATDLVSLPKTSSGFIGCLTFIDHCSKWAYAVPLRNKRADTVVKAIETGVLPYLPRKPVRLLSDNGPEFRSELFEDLMNKYDVDHVLSTPYMPASNGAIERFNRTLVETLRCVCKDPAHWEKELVNVLVNYNNSWHSALNMSPSDFLMKKSHLGNQVLVTDGKHWREPHPGFKSFSLDDLVLKRTPLQGNLVINKFRERYEGPYKVVKVNRNRVTYELEDADGSVLRAHHKQLKKYHPPNKIDHGPLVRHEHSVVDGAECSLEYETSSDEDDFEFSSKMVGPETLHTPFADRLDVTPHIADIHKDGFLGTPTSQSRTRSGIVDHLSDLPIDMISPIAPMHTPGLLEQPNDTAMTVNHRGVPIFESYRYSDTQNYWEDSPRSAEVQEDPVVIHDQDMNSLTKLIASLSRILEGFEEPSDQNDQDIPPLSVNESISGRNSLIVRDPSISVSTTEDDDSHQLNSNASDMSVRRFYMLNPGITTREDTPLENIVSSSNLVNDNRPERQETRDFVQQSRRRSRRKVLNQYRAGISDIMLQTPMRHTRSKGPVRNLPNVQPRVLEYM